MAITCTAVMKIPMPENKPMPKAGWQGSLRRGWTARVRNLPAAEPNQAEVRSVARLAAKRKSLARNDKTGCECSGSTSGPPVLYSRL